MVISGIFLAKSNDFDVFFFHKIPMYELHSGIIFLLLLPSGEFFLPKRIGGKYTEKK
jgi:hypothetical protein